MNVALGNTHYKAEGLVGNVSGDINMGSERCTEFLQKLAALMGEYNVDRIDVGWSLAYVKELNSQLMDKTAEAVKAVIDNGKAPAPREFNNEGDRIGGDDNIVETNPRFDMEATK